MRIDQILGNDPSEEILWDYTKNEASEDTSLKLGFSWGKSIIPAMIGITLFMTASMISGFFRTFFSIATPFCFALTIPLIMKLRERFKSTTKFERTRYTVTNKGIYIQTGIEYNEETLYIPLDKVNKVSVYGSTSSPDDSLGSVYISYSKSTDPAYSESGKDVDTMVCNITNIPDSGQVMELIEKSSEQRKAELDERKRLTGGISEAEKYREPTPLTAWRKKDDDTHTDPLIELRTMLTLAKEQKLPRAELEESVSNSARSLQTNTAVKTEKKKPVRKKTAGLVGDPQAAFFGDVRSMMPAPGEEPTFLDPDAATDEELLAMLSEDSVSDLQAELFGADAKLSGAFPDPTVNPLPEWKATEDPFFRQAKPEGTGTIPDSSAREQGSQDQATQGTFYQQGN